MYNADQFEGLGKLDLWHYANLMSEKGVAGGGRLPSPTAFSSPLSSSLCWPFMAPLANKSTTHTAAAAATAFDYASQMTTSAGAATAAASSQLLRRPFLFDDDSNLSLLSAAAFFVPKDFFGDLLLAQYLFKSGYYQPAGPLISHHHHHHHHHHHVQTNSTTTTSTAGLPAATATSASSSASTISFAKVSQSPLVQPPTPPASNVTQPVSEPSDNEMASATTPAAEIAVSESVADENSYSMNYRFSASANPPPFRSPSQHNYQNYYPSPPSTASLSHPHPSHPHPPHPHPPQQAHFQEILYSSNPPPGPSGPYHLGYMQPKGPPYHPPLQRRYIPSLPPQQYFHHHEYPAAAPASQQQVVVPAHHPLTSTAADSYHSAPPTPSIIESYPPPPPPLYYSGYSSAPPTPYYPYATSSRSLTLVETSCPCPLQGCQKNVHTGPLTGIISKGPVKQRNTPLSPVALSLPKEPQDIRSLPSPARGSAGSRPTPSPAIATAKHPSSWNEGSDYGYDTPGLLTFSKSSHDSVVDRDSGIDGTEVSPVKCKRRRSLSDRREMKKLKMRRKLTRSKAGAKPPACKSDEELAKVCTTFYDRVEHVDTVGVMSAAPLTGFVARVKPTVAPEVDANTTDACDSLEEQMDELLAENHRCCARWSGEEENSSEPEMPKLYPEVSPPPPPLESLRYGPPSPVDDEQPLAKRVKLGDEAKLNAGSPVDVEKNNYLSALQLCSVNELELRPDTKPAESLAPSRPRDEQHVKLPAKTKTNAAQDVPAKSAETEMDAGDALRLGSRRTDVDDVSSASCKTALATPNYVEPKKPRFRRRRWTTKKKKTKKKNSKASKGGSEEEKLEAENAERRRRAELLLLTQKRAACRLKWSNGWTWLGEPFVAKVFLNTEESEVLRTCYHAMKHQSGDIIRPKDCILLRSGCKKTDLPYVAKVAHLWEDPEDGEMMMSLFWYYRPEHTEHDAIHSESPYELYASKHKDMNSVACIEDKCYVLTFNEYCRYHKSIRQTEESVDVSSVIVPPLAKKRYPRQALLPPENTSLDLVFFCRKIYDFRQHRLLKNPFFV